MELSGRRYFIFASAMILLVVGLFLSLPGRNQPTGFAVSKLVVIQLTPHNCMVPLDTGLDLFSVPCFRHGVPLAQALSSIQFNQTISNRTFIVNQTNPLNHTNQTNYTVFSCTSSYKAVYTYDSNDLFDPWKVSNPCLPGYVINDLQILDGYHGYFIYILNRSLINYSGDISIPNIISLKRGYNLVSYPANDTINPRPVHFVLATINTTYLQLFSLQSGAWKVYSPTLQQFQNFEPFRGYWLEMSADDDWEVDW